EVGEVQTSHRRRAGADRARSTVPHLGGLPFGAAVVEGIHGDGAEHVVHDDAGDSQVLDQPTTATTRLDADPSVGALEHAVADHDVADATGHLAADDDPSVPADHRAVRDDDVLARHPLRCRLGAGLDRDAVIAHVDVAIADVHV